MTGIAAVGLGSLVVILPPSAGAAVVNVDKPLADTDSAEAMFSRQGDEPLELARLIESEIGRVALQMLRIGRATDLPIVLRAPRP